MGDGGEHRANTGLIPGPHGGFLKPPWKKGDPSPNGKGRPPIKRITAALVEILDKVGNEKAVAEAWFKMIVENHDSAALREALIRIEGHVPKDAQRELPSITLNVQSVQANVTGQPVPLPGQPSPAQHVGSLAASVELVEAVPLDDDDEEEDE